MPHEKQVTLNEHIDQPKPERHRTKPGFVSKFIHIPEDKYALLKKHIEAHDLDEGRFLTRQLSKIASELK